MYPVTTLTQAPMRAPGVEYSPENSLAEGWSFLLTIAAVAALGAIAVLVGRLRPKNGIVSNVLVGRVLLELDCLRTVTMLALTVGFVAIFDLIAFAACLISSIWQGLAAIGLCSVVIAVHAGHRLFELAIIASVRLAEYLEVEEQVATNAEQDHAQNQHPAFSTQSPDFIRRSRKHYPLYPPRPRARNQGQPVNIPAPVVLPIQVQPANIPAPVVLPIQAQPANIPAPVVVPIPFVPLAPTLAMAPTGPTIRLVLMSRGVMVVPSYGAPYPLGRGRRLRAAARTQNKTKTEETPSVVTLETQRAKHVRQRTNRALSKPSVFPEVPPFLLDFHGDKPPVHPHQSLPSRMRKPIWPYHISLRRRRHPTVRVPVQEKNEPIRNFCAPWYPSVSIIDTILKKRRRDERFGRTAVPTIPSLPYPRPHPRFSSSTSTARAIAQTDSVNDVHKSQAEIQPESVEVVQLPVVQDVQEAIADSQQDIDDSQKDTELQNDQEDQVEARSASAPESRAADKQQVGAQTEWEHSRTEELYQQNQAEEAPESVQTGVQDVEEAEAMPVIRPSEEAVVDVIEANTQQSQSPVEILAADVAQLRSPLLTAAASAADVIPAELNLTIVQDAPLAITDTDASTVPLFVASQETAAAQASTQAVSALDILANAAERASTTALDILAEAAQAHRRASTNLLDVLASAAQVAAPALITLPTSSFTFKLITATAPVHSIPVPVVSQAPISGLFGGPSQENRDVEMSNANAADPSTFMGSFTSQPAMSGVVPSAQNVLGNGSLSRDAEMSEPPVVAFAPTNLAALAAARPSSSRSPPNAPKGQSAPVNALETFAFSTAFMTKGKGTEVGVRDVEMEEPAAFASKADRRIAGPAFLRRSTSISPSPLEPVVSLITASSSSPSKGRGVTSSTEVDMVEVTLAEMAPDGVVTSPVEPKGERTLNGVRAKMEELSMANIRRPIAGRATRPPRDIFASVAAESSMRSTLSAPQDIGKDDKELIPITAPLSNFVYTNPFASSSSSSSARHITASRIALSSPALTFPSQFKSKGKATEPQLGSRPANGSTATAISSFGRAYASTLPKAVAWMPPSTTRVMNAPIIPSAAEVFEQRAGDEGEEETTSSDEDTSSEDDDE